eukprot:6083154-Pleurochrysis_carterae.AAC.1
MHATPMPRTTRVTRTAYGNGVRPHRLWSRRMYRTRLFAVCVTSPPPPHGASEQALHWPQGAACRRTRPAAAMRSTRRP